MIDQPNIVIVILELDFCALQERAGTAARFAATVLHMGQYLH